VDQGLERFETTDPGRHRDGHPVGIDSEVTGLVERLVGGDERELGELVETAALPLRDPGLGVPALDESWRRAGLLGQSLPQVVDSDAGSRDRADSCYYDSSLAHWSDCA